MQRKTEVYYGEFGSVFWPDEGQKKIYFFVPSFMGYNATLLRWSVTMKSTCNKCPLHGVKLFFHFAQAVSVTATYNGRSEAHRYESKPMDDKGFRTHFGLVETQ